MIYCFSLDIYDISCIVRRIVCRERFSFKFIVRCIECC